MSHSPDLQNSYGPEMAASEHHSNYGPQTVADDGPEAIPGQYYAAGQDAPQHIAPPYAQQAEKNDDSQGGEAGGTPAGTRKKILGLPVAGFWLLVGGFVLLVLGVSLGVGLGVGLSQKSTTTGSGGSSATSSAVPAGSQTSTTSAASSSASSVASTTTSSATSTSSSAAASDTDAPGASVAICQNAYQDYCTTISVPASSCSTCSPAAGYVLTVEDIVLRSSEVVNINWHS